jgi:hypothetical protein
VNKNFLLPREKYARASKEYGPSPFTFESEKDGQVLFYFGANHSNDPENHQYPVLQKYWEEFLERTEGKERLVLVEGSLRLVAPSEKEAIEKSSEGGWVTYFAHRESVPVACPDISTDDFAKMMPELDKEQWVLTSFLRWFDSSKKNLGEICEILKRKEYAKGVEVTPDNLKTLYKHYIGKDFNENESQNYLVDPNRDGAITNKLAREHSDLREVKIVEEIERYWKEGKSIFIAFGSGHLIIQRPALEMLLN